VVQADSAFCRVHRFIHHNPLLDVKFALLGYSGVDGFVSLTGSDQYCPLDGRLSIDRLVSIVDKRVEKMVRVQPYINAYQICSGNIKDYSVLRTRVFPWNQVYRRILASVVVDLEKDPFDYMAINRLKTVGERYAKLREMVDKER
jgi:hypothetical protein